MQPIQKIFSGDERKIENNYEYGFDISEDGIYLIEIIASAKSWIQNLLKIKFGDDDLAVKIDNIEFSKLNKRRGLFDGEAAWNGNNLKGLLKTGVFIVFLNKGNHIVKFLTDKKPELKSIKISSITKDINYIPEDNNPAEDGNRRQWITISLSNLPLKQLAISAVCKKYNHPNDDDDLKLIIDGKVQYNPEEKNHYFSYWCGARDDGKEKTFQKEFNLSQGVHYIEFWADRMPEVKSINLDSSLNAEIGNDENKERVPTADNPGWTGDFNDDPEDIILARLIFGEASNQPHEAKIWIGCSVINRTKAKSWWPSTIHGVILQNGQYDPFNPSDRNYKKIISPIDFEGENEIDKESWKECCEIASGIVSGRISNPTEATHFHGIGQSREDFEKNIVPNGKFIKKIGDTYFYWSPN